MIRDFGDSFEDQDVLGLSPCLMDKKVVGAHPDLPGSGSVVPARGGTLPRNVRVVWAGQSLCRRWYTWCDGQPGTNRKTCRGSSGLRILEMWVSFTIAVCALLLDVRELVRGMLCKRHRWFEKLSVLSLVEAGEWMFVTSRIFCAIRSKRRFSLCRRI